MKAGTRKAAVIAMAVLAGIPLLAQTQGGSRTAPQTASPASKAAGSFTLDLPTPPQDEAVTAPSEPAAASPAPAASAAAEPVATSSSALFTLDTPIVQLIADPRARAVLDKDLPGLSDDENLAKFRTLSLRRFQPLTGGQLTDELLAKAEADLAAIRPAPRGKGRNDSR